ncbi:MAG: DoxX family protein [Chloroflexi bacterium]|nr:DoxX family protein [Chloroflexota bacterium]
MRDKHGKPTVLRRLGRIGIASVFIHSGIDAAFEPGMRPAKLEAVGIPEPELMVRLNGAGMAIAGTTLGLGIRPRESALALLALLVPTTLVGHAFWNEEGPARRMQEMQFLKNVALAGGLLTVIASES